MMSTRREAREANEKFYFSGLPCKHGHIAIRRVDNGACVVCHRAASARQFQKLKDGPPELLAWHYARQKAYVEGKQPPPRPMLTEEA